MAPMPQRSWPAAGVEASGRTGRAWRSWPLLWALLAALGLHLALWTGMRTGVPGGVVGLAPEAVRGGVAPGLHVRLMADAAQVRVDDVAPAADASVSAPVPAQASPVTPVPPVAAEAGGHAGVAASYWPSEQLSQGPRPELDWVLDEEALGAVRQGRMWLRLWVSEQGRIDRVALLSAEPAGEWAGRAVQRLADTRMQPGLKDGRTVPASVVVEIASEIERFR